jgi:hypothetical protein
METKQKRKIQAPVRAAWLRREVPAGGWFKLKNGGYLCELCVYLLEIFVCLAG